MSEYIRTRVFTRTKSNGMIVEWHQEDESAVASKADAIAMIQRTIDFWLPMLIQQLQKKNGLSPAEAQRVAKQSYLDNIQKMETEPFAIRWGVKQNDLTFDMVD